MHRIAIALVLVLGFSTQARAATYVIDPNGNDGANGSSATPWKSWGKFVHSINSGAVHGGDTVMFRPGRYTACSTLSGINEQGQLNGGGTAGNPVTVTVDTSVSGDVEIHGSAAPGECGIGAWLPANQCSGGSMAGAACDSGADCLGAGGTCVPLVGVYYSQFGALADHFAGDTGGVAFQPNKSAGLAPKIYEILYGPPAAAGVPVKFPAFTQGHDQVFPYPSGSPQFGTVCSGGSNNGNACGSAANCPGGACVAANICTSSRVPWMCCTGAGSGNCANGSRIYVQTASGGNPSSSADATYGEVEIPVMQTLLWQGFNPTNQSPPPTANYINFTNHTGAGGADTGRTFFWWWALVEIQHWSSATHILMEDFDVAYNSRIKPEGLSYPLSTGATFPRYAGGETYLVTLSNASFMTFRHGKIHGSQGNEMVHIFGGSSNSFFDDVEFADGPWAVLNTFVSTASTLNAETGQVQRQWPPPGYSAWNARYPTHWGPLGGGGNTDGAIIAAAPLITVQNSNFHDVGLISFFEGTSSGGLIFQNNTIDLERMQYSDGFGAQPNQLISYCGGSGGCGGLEGRLALGLPALANGSNNNGFQVRNNVFYNVYGIATMIGAFENTCGETLNAPPPATANMFVNNTYYVKGDPLYDPQPVFAITRDVGSSAVKMIFKNNNFYRVTAPASATNFFNMYSQPTLASCAAGATTDLPNQHIDMDYNNWGGQNITWRILNNSYATYGGFQGGIRTYTATNETHSKNADPLYVSPPLNLAIQTPASPSYQTGLDLSAVGWSPTNQDFNHNPRPAGLWSIGAYQDASNTVVTTTTIIQATTTSTVGVPTTTSTTILGSATQLWTSDPPVISTDTGAVELGVYFKSAVGGNITALKYYKAVSSTGVHIGNLWSQGGVKLASATFTGETSQGWQTATLATPFHITAGTTYLVSYYAPAGGYSHSLNFFAVPYDNSPFHVFGNAEIPNGAFIYSPVSAFPTNNYQASNYWPDIVFVADTVNPPPSTTSTVTVTSTSTSTSSTSSTLPNATTSTTLKATTTTIPNIVTTTTTSTSTSTIPGTSNRHWRGGNSLRGLRRGF